MKTAKALAVDIFLWSYTCVVAYKIVYQKLWLGMRFESFSWNGPLLACLIGTLLATGLFWTPPKFPMSLGRALNGLYNFKEHEPWGLKPFALWGYFVVALTFLAGIVVAQVSLREFFSPQGLSGARRIFGALLNPNFGIIEDALFAAIETIYMAFIATTVALPFAFALSFFAARNLMSGGFFFPLDLQPVPLFPQYHPLHRAFGVGDYFFRLGGHRPLCRNPGPVPALDFIAGQTVFRAN